MTKIFTRTGRGLVMSLLLVGTVVAGAGVPTSPALAQAPIYVNCPLLNYNLSFGMVSSDITSLQAFLAAQGYFHTSPIGRFGPQTFYAVQQFQMAHGVPGTGFVGPLTRGVINSIQNCQSPVPPIPPPTSAPFIQNFQPSSGAVGTTIAISGYGFTGSNTIYFGGSSFTGYSSNGTTLTFTVPSYLSPNCPLGAACALWVRMVTPGNYSIYVQNQNGTSNTVNFVVTDQTTTNPTPFSITGLDAPASMSVGETRTWTVHTSLDGAANPNLRYSIVWGDEVPYVYGSAPSSAQTIQTSAGFTHTYVRPGTYTPSFTITSNTTGQTVTTSATVLVNY